MIHFPIKSRKFKYQVHPWGKRSNAHGSSSSWIFNIQYSNEDFLFFEGDSIDPSIRIVFVCVCECVCVSA